MSNSLYVATSEPQSGKSLVTLGLIDLALRRTNKVGIFRPIIHSKGVIGDRDDHLDLLLSKFNLDLEFDECYAFTRDEASDLVGHGKTDRIVEKVISKFKKLEKRFDFILIEGTDFLGESSVFEFDLNAVIAKNLGTPVLLVESGDGETLAETKRNLNLAVDSFLSKECHVLGVIMNRMPEENMADGYDYLKKDLPSDVLLSLVPESQILKSPTIGEIAYHLNAEILYGKDKLQDLVYGYTVAAMHIPNFLDKFKEKFLIITPGDRHDIIMATLMAHFSLQHPNITGIVLTGGFKPPSSVAKILDGLSDIVPILSVKDNTFQTAMKANDIPTKLNIDNNRKINLSLETFEKYVDASAIAKNVFSFQPKGMTPKMFNYILVQKAKSKKMHIVLPEGQDERILKAADLLLSRGIVKLTLLGKEEEIQNEIGRLGLNFEGKEIEFITPNRSNSFISYVETLYELRQHKGVNLEIAGDLMSDVSYYGTMMVYKGDADGMVSGAAHTTQHTIRPALQFVKTKPGVSVVSSVFFMCLDDRVLVYGDCAVNPNPNSEQLSEIAISSAETSKEFGIEPRLAMLSYSSGSSGKGEEVEKVRKATEIVKEKLPQVKIEGPIQYDAAVDLAVGSKKMPGSEVAGRATVLIFPDLNTGNNTYKAVQRETGAIAIGPILQGLNKPVNDLSRGCTVEDIVNTVIITAIQAQSSN
ncbi:MAG: phosphate acetyltransferase [Saprospiraceae bacterium]|nr:phosphate acetyltransferase [Saprospiraceae bacterium]